MQQSEATAPLIQEKANVNVNIKLMLTADIS